MIPKNRSQLTLVDQHEQASALFQLQYRTFRQQSIENNRKNNQKYTKFLDENKQIIQHDCQTQRIVFDKNDQIQSIPRGESRQNLNRSPQKNVLQENQNCNSKFTKSQDINISQQQLINQSFNLKRSPLKNVLQENQYSMGFTKSQDINILQQQLQLKNQSISQDKQENYPDNFKLNHEKQSIYSMQQSIEQIDQKKSSSLELQLNQKLINNTKYQKLIIDLEFKNSQLFNQVQDLQEKVLELEQIQLKDQNQIKHLNSLIMEQQHNSFLNSNNRTQYIEVGQVIDLLQELSAKYDLLQVQKQKFELNIKEQLKEQEKLNNLNQSRHCLKIEHFEQLNQSFEQKKQNQQYDEFLIDEHDKQNSSDQYEHKQINEPRLSLKNNSKEENSFIDQQQQAQMDLLNQIIQKYELQSIINQ